MDIFSFNHEPWFLQKNFSSDAVISSNLATFLIEDLAISAKGYMKLKKWEKRRLNGGDKP